jgi:glycosyltransferase involved in cell wall biosynthesis
MAYLCLQPMVQGQASFAHVTEIIRGLQVRGMPVRLFSVEPSSSHAGVAPRLLQALRVQLTLIGHMRSFRLLYVRNHPLALLAVLVARLARVPVIIEVNGTEVDLAEAWPFTRHVSGLLKVSTRFQMRCARSVIAVTEQLAEWVRREAGGDAEVHVVPNGANTELFHPDSSSPIDRSYVLFFGAFASWQGISTILRAASSPAWPDGIRVVLAGDGAARGTVEEAVDRCPDTVEYVGVVPYVDLPQLVAGALAGLSVQEAVADRGLTGVFPLKVFETLASGRPVIASNLPGQSGLIREAECGLLIEPADSDALAAAVAHLADNPEEADEMGARGARIVRLAHSWDARAERTLDILTSALNS